jgi:hypothetical protein
MDYRHGIQGVIYIVYTSIKLKFLIIYSKIFVIILLVI